MFQIWLCPTWVIMVWLVQASDNTVPNNGQNLNDYSEMERKHCKMEVATRTSATDPNLLNFSQRYEHLANLDKGCALWPKNKSLWYKWASVKQPVDESCEDKEWRLTGLIKVQTKRKWRVKASFQRVKWTAQRTLENMTHLSGTVGMDTVTDA